MICEYSSDHHYMGLAADSALRRIDGVYNKGQRVKRLHNRDFLLTESHGPHVQMASKTTIGTSVLYR